MPRAELGPTVSWLSKLAPQRQAVPYAAALVGPLRISGLGTVRYRTISKIASGLNTGNLQLDGIIAESHISLSASKATQAGDRLNVNPLHTNCQPVYDLGAKDGTK